MFISQNIWYLYLNINKASDIAKKLKVVEFKLKEVDKRKDLVTCEKQLKS